MKRYGAWLFGMAAIVNLSVAIGFLVAPGPIEALIGLDPVRGTNLVFLNFVAMVVGLFGYSYVRIALDPVRFRPQILIGALGKLLAELSALAPWLRGEITFLLPAVLLIDVVFALLFLDYLRRTGEQSMPAALTRPRRNAPEL